ncbi:MAG TPA: RluA family pseudouridine synthase [Firmicutes bacterium]|nr:RluA family pseudouridine synthase [Bacillota bacterium]
MYKYLRKKRIKVNSGRGDISYRLKEGDVIQLYINDEFFIAGIKNDFLSARGSVDIIYEDENIVLINKKQGLLSHDGDGRKDYASHSDKGGKTSLRGAANAEGTDVIGADKSSHSVAAASFSADTLINRLKRYLYEKGEYNPYDEHQFAPALANRLDRNTCGIVIAAKNAEALRILNEKIKLREIDKFYLCIVHGTPVPASALLTAYLIKNSSENRVYISDSPVNDGLTIKTKYSVISSKGNYSLLEIELLTGRTHQIRAHMAHIGHPLLGDGKYGKNAADKKLGFKSQALCSYKLRFSFKTDAGCLNYLNGKEFVLNDVWFLNDFYNKI